LIGLLTYDGTPKALRSNRQITAEVGAADLRKDCIDSIVAGDTDYGETTSGLDLKL